MLCAALLFLFTFSSAQPSGHATPVVASTTLIPRATPVPCECARLQIGEPLDLGDDRTIGVSLIGDDEFAAYRWKVSTGTIVAGQGTRSITVRMGQTHAYILQVTVDVSHRSKDCTCPRLERTFREYKLRPGLSFLQGDLKGQVLTFGRTAKPIAEALVELVYAGEVRDSVRTDSKGQYAFGPIAADDIYTIRATSGGVTAARTARTRANKRITVPAIRLKVP